MLVSSPRPKHSVPGFPDKVENVCYKVLQCPDTLRCAKTRISGWYQNMRYINKISTLWIIYHQKGLDEEPNYVISTLSQDISEMLLKCPFVHKMSKVLYYNSNKMYIREPTASWYGTFCICANSVKMVERRKGTLKALKGKNVNT